jgi:hypothetical protein
MHASTCLPNAGAKVQIISDVTAKDIFERPSLKQKRSSP